MFQELKSPINQQLTPKKKSQKHKSSTLQASKSSGLKNNKKQPKIDP
jgi:hypothetical protein